MNGFIRYLRSDFLKLKRQSQLPVHAAVPFLGIVIFLVYCSFTHRPPAAKAAGYLETLGVVFPTMIGIVCAISADKEVSAGNYQFMLGSPEKLLPFISMLTSLLILGFGAVTLASVGFGAGFTGLLHLTPFNLAFYFYAASILLLSSIFLYVLHLMVALRFGNGASVGLGFAESLISALMLTGLGEGTWQFIPCAWGARLVTYFSQYIFDASSASSIIPDVRLGTGLCVAGTTAAILFACVWFYRWEGKKSEE